ncbi:MAG: STAS domain-containing protein [Armatimonadetes bacterium]|nr:STAS domain-containing protein [Armatimonadota bacterium]
MIENTGLSIEVLFRNQTPIVRVHGTLDLHTAKDFGPTLERTIQQVTNCLIVDLSDIPYLDSAGLSVLRSTYETLAKNGKELYVIAPREHLAVYRVLEISRLNELFKVRPNVDDALEEASCRSSDQT